MRPNQVIDVSRPQFMKKVRQILTLSDMINLSFRLSAMGEYLRFIRLYVRVLCFRIPVSPGKTSSSEVSTSAKRQSTAPAIHRVARYRGIKFSRTKFVESIKFAEIAFAGSANLLHVEETFRPGLRTLVAM